MVNKQRVRRIKNLIYAFLIIVLLLPAILMVVLGLKILDTNKKIIDLLSGANPQASYGAPSSLPQNEVSEPESQPAPGGGFVIEPDGASVNNQDSDGEQDEGEGSVLNNLHLDSVRTPASDESAPDEEESQAGAEAPNDINGMTQTADGVADMQNGFASSSSGISSNGVNAGQGGADSMTGDYQGEADEDDIAGNPKMGR